MVVLSAKDLRQGGRRSFVIAGLVAFFFMAAPQPMQAQDADPSPLCARGASAGDVPMEHLLQIEQQEYFAKVIERMDAEAFAPDPDAPPEELYYAGFLPMAIEWPGVLADRAAELPRAAHDLPWLITLAGIEAGYLDPIYVLTQSTESILSPEMLPVMERHGLTEEARALRMVMALFPEWSADPADRMRSVSTYNSEVVDKALADAIEAAGRVYPRGEKRAAAAALRLVDASPEVRADYEARRKEISAEQKLDWLMGRLWVECPTDWSTPAEADRSLAAMGSAQAALLMIEGLIFSLEDASLSAWFDSYEASMAAQVAHILALRGEEELAKALHSGMAEFPRPYPRDTEERWQAMQSFDDATYTRLDLLLPEDSYERLRAVMIGLAIDSGLLDD